MNRARKAIVLGSFTTTALAIAAGWIASQGGMQALRRPASIPVIAERPEEFGDNLPPEGRSLFDQIFTKLDESTGNYVYDIPFPYSDLIDRVNGYLSPGIDPAETGKIKGVLIPIGRSLQRNAAAPDKYFRSPRAVLFVDSPTAQKPGQVVPIVKDRLYIGYQERVGILEAISYNETAGRFEYQVVHGYMPSTKREVFQATRGTCLSCHQNHTPLFSVRNWLETNANPDVQKELLANTFGFTGTEPGITDIAKRLTTSASGEKLYHGIPIQIREIVPNQFEDATERAQHLIAYNRLWRESCDDGSGQATKCRAALLNLALRTRLVSDQLPGDDQPDYQQVYGPVSKKMWEQLYPDGFAIPNPNIPNRDPFRDIKPPGLNSVTASEIPVELSKVLTESNVPADKDPANLNRAPFAVWRLSGDQDSGPNRLIAGLSKQFQLSDIQYLDDQLLKLAQKNGMPAKTYDGGCGIRSAADPSDPQTQLLDIACGDPTAPVAGSSGTLQLRARVRVKGSEILDGSIDPLSFKATTENCNLKGFFSLCPRLSNVQVSGGFGQNAQGRWVLRMEPRRPLSRLRVRRPSGQVIDTIEISWTTVGDDTASVKVTAYDDFEQLRGAVASLASDTDSGTSQALSAAPFSRMKILPALYAKLGIQDSANPTPFARDLSKMPVAKVDTKSTLKTPEFQIYVRRCALCHDNTDGVPPNWAHGTDEVVAKQIAQCAPRMLYKLYEWDKPDQAAAKPMPRPASLRREDGTPMPITEWVKHPDFFQLRQETENQLNKAIAAGVHPADLTKQKILSAPLITALPPCLPTNK